MCDIATAFALVIARHSVSSYTTGLYSQVTISVLEAAVEINKRSHFNQLTADTPVPGSANSHH